MFRFLGRIFAMIGLVVTFLAVAALFLHFRAAEKRVEKPAAMILSLDFDQPLTEKPEASPLDLALNEQVTPLLDMLRAIDRAKGDPNVKALVARFGGTQLPLAQAQEIRDAIGRFRAAGKPAYAFGTTYGQFGLGNRAYYLASGFDQIWLQPVGSVGLTGLALEEPFAKTALGKLGVEADFMQREEYKSFMDAATRDDFAPPVRANLQAMIDDMASQEEHGIAESRGWDPMRVRDLMARGPYTDEEAVKEGLVTRLGYIDELEKEVRARAGKDAVVAGPDDYLALHPAKAAAAKADVALIYGIGLILDKVPAGSDWPGETVMGANDVANAIDDATDDANVKAILFRVDSPGGSPEASETVRRAIVRAREAGKPVIVSMGEVAASGGYWISMNADRIVADPGTITGSIGVIAGKFNVQGLLQKLGVTMQSLKTADSAGMWSPTQAFTPAQRERMNAMLDSSYRAFVQRVAEARKIPLETMPDIAKGRVWTGAQALKLGLVDELGGYDAALAAIRKKLNLADNDPLKLVPFPAPETPVTRALKILRNLGIEAATLHSSLSAWQGMLSALSPALDDAARARAFMGRAAAVSALPP